MPDQYLMILLTSGIIVAIIGFWVLLAPEARRSSYISSVGTVVSSGSGPSAGKFPVLSFEFEGQMTQAKVRMPVSDGMRCSPGMTLPISCCRTSMPLRGRCSVVVDSDGSEAQKLAKGYLLMGGCTLFCGILLLVLYMLLK